jgi:CheY-like chemotaxis protein
MMEPATGARRARILVVDDEKIVLDLFSEILALDGHEIFKERDPEKALEMLKTLEVDLIISDFRMPKLTGEEFFAGATGMKPGLAKRFVFTSGEMDPETKRRFIDATGVNVIAKPFQVQEVRTLVRSLLEAGVTN